jgi:hypothetical protein
VDLSKESEATLKLYGIDDPTSESYGKVLLRARRLVERGVRFVQVVSGYPSNISDQERRSWDAHSDLDGNHATQARMVDKPIAGLLTDLKALGLLDTTLVVWASEFSRTSWGESGTGRDHNPWGYTQWLAGGGMKAGFTYGETDDIGLQVADKDKGVDTYDLHATVLHLLASTTSRPPSEQRPLRASDGGVRQGRQGTAGLRVGGQAGPEQPAPAFSSRVGAPPLEEKS